MVNNINKTIEKFSTPFLILKTFFKTHHTEWLTWKATYQKIMFWYFVIINNIDILTDSFCGEIMVVCLNSIFINIISPDNIISGIYKPHVHSAASTEQ